MNVASFAVFFILAGLSYLHIVGREGSAPHSQEHCSSYNDASSCYNNVNCAWCLASGANSARCIDDWSNASACGSCATAPNETICKGTMNPTPVSVSWPRCFWASGRFGKMGCYGNDEQKCALRAIATCSTYPNFECGICGGHCVPSNGHHSACPACSAYTNGSLCSQGLVPGGPSGSFCFLSHNPDRCTSCGLAKTVADCAAFEDRGEPCGWCEGHGCVPKADNAHCPNCTALLKVNQTTCTASLNPNYNRWAINPSPKRCLWVDGQCGEGGSAGECALATTPSACLSQRYDGFKRCGWCGDHCSKSGRNSAAKCPNCSTYANASYCPYSLIPRPGGSNDYCLWDSASERCFGSGSAFCKSFTNQTSCRDRQAGNTRCRWCNDALGCISTADSQNCTSCSVLSGTNRSTCESYWGDHSPCVWYNGGCFSDYTALCASLTTMTQCYPGPRSGQLCGWCGGKCLEQHSSATASCPNCSSLVSATDCSHSVNPNGQPGGRGLCIWSHSFSRCFGGQTKYCAAFSNNATACAAAVAGASVCGMCGKHGCVRRPSFGQPACPMCDTITTADLCKASYIPNSQGPSLRCAWKGGKCVNPNAAP